MVCLTLANWRQMLFEFVLSSTLALPLVAGTTLSAHTQSPPPSTSPTVLKSVSSIDVKGIQDLRGKTPFIPLDNPLMVPVAGATYLPDDEPVLGLDLPEGRQAFPLRMLSWHHIVNAQVGKRPLVVTYCKACNAGVAFDALFQNIALTFSLYGFYQHSFVMFDRETESLWYQLDGRGLEGRWRGKSLKMVGLFLTDWKHWKSLHPDTLVIGASPSQFSGYPPMESTQASASRSAPNTLIWFVSVGVLGFLIRLLFGLKRDTASK